MFPPVSFKAYILCPGNYVCNDHVTLSTADTAFCIPMVQICDGVNQCPTAEDEKECGKYH